MTQICVNITTTSKWARWRLKSPASRLFTQSFIQAQIKENLQAPCHWPLWGEFTGDRWISRTKGQWRGKCFHLMTSSWAGTAQWRAEHFLVDLLNYLVHGSKWSGLIKSGSVMRVLCLIMYNNLSFQGCWKTLTKKSSSVMGSESINCRYVYFNGNKTHSAYPRLWILIHLIHWSMHGKCHCNLKLVIKFI